ncbi:hypothetical protein E4U53_000416 [Claviceps sorghi]|nr:hypothetical protein E4U53_000416 [Claviceps sorghi]
MRVASRDGLPRPVLSSSSPSSALSSSAAGQEEGGGGGEESHLSDEASLQDQDEAQLALQPAISAAASHLTSAQTPAAEKAAALERLPGVAYFGSAVVEEDDDGDDGDDDDDDDDDDDNGHDSGHGHVDSATNKTVSPRPDPRPRPHSQTIDAVTGHQRHVQGYSSLPLPSHRHQQHQQQQQPPPEQLPIVSTPGTVDGSKSFVPGKDPSRSRPTKGLLESAFGPTRQRRSLSAGQEALKKLQKALPSFGGHASFLPSLPTSFLSNLTGENKQSSNNMPTPSKPGGAPARLRSATTSQQPPPPASGDSTTRAGSSSTSRPRPRPRLRPPMLRRVTSDESMLYHSLSRQSSLGDDNKFHDVREMVNIRFMAIKDSLPDVPNFRMPSLARLHVAARIPSMSLNGLFSSASDDNAAGRHVPDAGRETRSPLDPGAAGRPSSVTSAVDGVLAKLTGDLVILGGYRGSVLRSAEPPHQQLWAPVKLGFNMRKVNLEVGLEDGDEETMEERIVPSGMLKHVGPVDISRKLFKKLRSSPNARNGTLRLWDFGYDWRLSPALSSKKLQDFLAELPSNRPGTGTGTAAGPRGALVIAHSLGGLITRHAVNQRPELFAGVLYAGVPQRCINILGPFRNGDAVLFNEKLLSARVNFSIRTSFVLLPDDGFCFIDKETGESYPVDFFDADEWARWRLSPCVAPLLPPYGRDKQQGSLHSPLSSLFPSARVKNKKAAGDHDGQANAAAPSAESQVAPLPSPPQSPGSAAGSPPGSHPDPPPGSPPGSPAAAADEERRRYTEYLRRTLAATSKFRSELAHNQKHESANAYPPHAVLYGKTIPTVYAAQVANREAIAHADAYDDLVFRPGDGVVLAREAMLPEGYAVVRSGRVSTERGHLTMLGDVAAVAKALGALLRGRQKGIGTGTGTGTGTLTGRRDDAGIR